MITYEIVEIESGEVVETMTLSDRAYAGLLKKIDFERFFVREKA